MSVRNEGPSRGEATAVPVCTRRGRQHRAPGSGAERGAQDRCSSREQRARVSWLLPVAALAFIGPDLDRILEAGRFEIHVGQSADPAELLSSSIELLPASTP